MHLDRQQVFARLQQLDEGANIEFLCRPARVRSSEVVESYGVVGEAAADDLLPIEEGDKSIVIVRSQDQPLHAGRVRHREFPAQEDRAITRRFRPKCGLSVIENERCAETGGSAGPAGIIEH